MNEKPPEMPDVWRIETAAHSHIPTVPDSPPTESPPPSHEDTEVEHAEEPKEMDRHTFFHGEHGIVSSLFNRRITPKQVSGCERIIDAFDKFQPDGLLEQLAYILATSYHETQRRMQPVRETLATKHEEAIRRLDRAWEKGQLTWVSKPYWRDGYYGRGDVQLTHQYNYEGKLRDAVLDNFGQDIAEDPDLALHPEISAYIMIEGMMVGDTGISDFTSRELERYINHNQTDYHNARRTVNPGDRPTYSLVAVYAQKFEEALRESGYKA